MKFINLWLIIPIIFTSIHVQAQLKLGDQPTIINKAVALDVQGSNGMQGLWLPRVSDTSLTGIRYLNPPDGLVIYHTPSGKMLLRSNNAWISYYTNALQEIFAGSQSVSGPDVTFLTGTAAGTTNDFNLVANSAANSITFNLPSASATARGVITTGTQTLAGVKTFSNGIQVSAGGVAVNAGGAVIAGASGNVSNLTLGVNATTATTDVTNNNLTVNNSGNVILAKNAVTAPSSINIKTFEAVPAGLPFTVTAGSGRIITFTFPAGTNLSTRSTVQLSPSTILNAGTGIGWAVVTSATTIQANLISGFDHQPYAAGYKFYITVMEF